MTSADQISTRKGEIAYGVVAGIVWLVYVVSIFVGEARRRRDRKAAVRAEAEPKRHGSDSSDATGPVRHGHHYA